MAEPSSTWKGLSLEGGAEVGKKTREVNKGDFQERRE